MYYQEAKAYAIKRLEEELPDHLYYHNVYHTIDVCSVTEELAVCENIRGENLALVCTAAAFHDIGFIHRYQGHEIESCQIAEASLPQFSFTHQQIETIKTIILATRMPQNPQSHLEEIICDADLNYLGRKDFFKIADTLQKEWLTIGIITSADDWVSNQIQFLEQHYYFTKTAQEKRDFQKKKNLLKLKKLQ